MDSFLDPAILFFVFGLVAGTVRSNLEIPPQVARFLSLYLLMALGLKGGFALHRSGLTPDVLRALGCALALAVAIPAIGYVVLRRRLDGLNAAAIAATYGSVSAVTFITAVQYMDTQGLAYGRHMAAAMALMESPAIIMAVLLANLVRHRAAAARGGAAAVVHMPIGKVLHESFTDGAQLLLLGALAVGILTGESGEQAMRPFAGDLFKGMLAFFLLDMGLLASRHVGSLRGQSPWLLAYALLAPFAHAGIAWLLARARGRRGHRRHRAAHGAGRQRVVHRRAGGGAACDTRSESVAVLRHVAGRDVPAQHPVRHPAVRGLRARHAVGAARCANAPFSTLRAGR